MLLALVSAKTPHLRNRKPLMLLMLALVSAETPHLRNGAADAGFGVC